MYSFKDLFLWVIRHNSQLFSVEDCRKFLTVSHSFRKLIRDNSSFIVFPILAKVLNSADRMQRHWFKNVFYPLINLGLTNDQIHKVKFALETTRNRIKNASCKHGFEDWEVPNDSQFGRSWVIEKWVHPILKDRPNQMAFCGSYDWCNMSQTINLESLPILNEIPCILQAGVYAGRRPDCGCETNYEIELQDENGNSIFTKYSYMLDLPISHDGIRYVQILLNVFEKEGIKKAKKVVVTLSTKDEKYWDGNYAARFTDMFLRVLPLEYFLGGMDFVFDFQQQ